MSIGFSDGSFGFPNIFVAGIGNAGQVRSFHQVRITRLEPSTTLAYAQRHKALPDKRAVAAEANYKYLQALQPALFPPGNYAVPGIRIAAWYIGRGFLP